MCSGHRNRFCVEAIPWPRNSERLCWRVHIDEHCLSIGRETGSGELSLQSKSRHRISIPVGRDSSQVVINDFGVLILTDD